VNFDDDQAKFLTILTVARGSAGNVLVVLTGFVVGFFSVIGGVLFMEPEVLSWERKGFVVIAALFTMTSAFHLAKLIRDLGDPVLAAEVHLPFVFLVVGSFVVACALGVGGVQMMPILEPQKRFITNCLLFTIMQTQSLAKMARDNHEVGKITQAMGVARKHESAAAHLGKIFGV